MTQLLRRKDIFWGYCAQFINMGSSFLLLPVLVRFLTPEEVGLWFVFITLASLAQLLDFGIMPTLSRNASYVYAGAQQLQSKGLGNISDNSDSLNLDLLADLLAAARKTYRWVALFVAILLVFCGSGYVYSLIPAGSNNLEILIGWLAFALGYVINFYYSYYIAFLQGRGDVTPANKVIVFSRGMLTISGACFIAIGWGLLGLGVASLISCIISRIISHCYFFTPLREESLFLKKKTGNSSRLIPVLKTNTWNLGLVFMGSFLIHRGNILIASTFLGLEVAASYGLTLQVLMALASVSSILSSLQMPRMNALQVNKQLGKLKSIYGSIVISSWTIYAIGALLLIMFGYDVLSFIGSQTELFSVYALTVFVLIEFLDMNHGNCAVYLMTLNNIPFMKSAIYSGCAILVSSLMLINFTSLGLWSLILSQGIVQASYNNWKWPLELLKQLKCDPIELLKSGMQEMRSIIRGTSH